MVQIPEPRSIHNFFVDVLDEIGPTERISLLLHTSGGDIAAAWRLVNLIKTFCDDFEVLIPYEAMSAGTLISLGAHRIFMTKQAVLGPIDPSLHHPLGPNVPHGDMESVPVSVEAVWGYLDAAQQDLRIKDEAVLGSILDELSNKVHPLVLGEIFRSRTQIRFLAEKLLKEHIRDPNKRKAIVDFLCADSGSHDYTINRREGLALGLNVEKPGEDCYKWLKHIHLSYSAQMKFSEPINPRTMVPPNSAICYKLVKGLIESVDGGSVEYISEGQIRRQTLETPMGPQDEIKYNLDFEGWRKL